MSIFERAGTIATSADLTNIPKLLCDYYLLTPDMSDISQHVCFGTSGHRGCATKQSFNQQHIWAITQAIVDYRTQANISGELILGIDTHALSQAAYFSALEVLCANKVNVVCQLEDSFTPTPVVSQTIVARNLTSTALVDGIIITPSHNPPQDGGIKYNPPHGGPAESDITAWIEQRANQYLQQQLHGINKMELAQARQANLIDYQDLMTPYVNALAEVINLDAIRDAKVKIGVDPLGGSGIYYWDIIASKFELDITVVNDKVDPSFSFMPLDKDGKIRMDCSSPYAMASLLQYKNDFDICVGNDPDYDRHGIVCPGTGLMNPNHYLAVAIDYLLTYRPGWVDSLAIGKTLVSSAMIDKVCASHGRRLIEVPVGFKWFVDGLSQQTIAFGGEESAGAAFLKHDGTTWCTDKDGFILALLAAEIIAVTGQTPEQRYQLLVEKFGACYYKRIDSPISLEQKAKFSQLTAEQVTTTHVAGDEINQVMTHAPGNNAAIGGLKVTTNNGWFAARPSGTEALFKIYAESYVSDEHLLQLIADAQLLVADALK
ncbi:phosphoglucomutase (alpha-D-glucose-1,6-bisphosphate-dependent) [Shewanella marina]|uniref:phosphoglucomutase (alpha-D-glucose-1,6-bisphosphate-dependent) n=1 Tax=Shewanella marina TaxID=487319 RepID=UPI0004723750|nr:phosphoglucomutase (alpha-D-glucose-1,6-bisphosphate-dependent) [Shewanella marina]